jgi:hypothetical protein
VVLAADTCNGSTDNAIATFFAHAEPSAVNSTGVRSFASDQRGTLYQKTDGTPILSDMSDGIILQ